MSFSTTIIEELGHPIIYLKDENTGYFAEIYAFGAILNKLAIPHRAGFTQVIDGYESVDQAIGNLTKGFKSAKLSPFVCRMHKGAYQHGNKAYQVCKHFLGNHALHGLIYDATYCITDTRGNDLHASVTLVHEYTGDLIGFPFPYQISIRYTLSQYNHLQISTTVTNLSEEVIPMADGWHPYFHLGDSSIDACSLQLRSVTQLAFDSELIPTGEFIPDNRFETSRNLSGIELDNSFLVTPGSNEPVCVLKNQSLQLTITANDQYPIIQVYTPADRKSIAIENLSGPPDNFNNGIGLVLLDPGASRSFNCNYTFTEI